MASNQFGANDLEGQHYCRHQHQQGRNRGSVSVSRGTEQTRHRDVIGKVHRAHQSGTGKQGHAPAYNLATQSFQGNGWRRAGPEFMR